MRGGDIMLKFVKVLAIAALFALVVAPVVTVSKETKVGGSLITPYGGPGDGVRP